MNSDPWDSLKSFTAARIALGRSGGSVPTSPQLDFRLAHASARDAVNAPFDPAQLAGRLASSGIVAHVLESCAVDRAEFLRRPDFGRKLSDRSRVFLESLAMEVPDLVIVASDGLSTFAAERQVPAFLEEFLPLVQSAQWVLAPVFVVKHGRVAVQDEVGGILGAKISLMLLGERPGLGSPDSLGAYFTRNPMPGLNDASRNCVSNIRPEGLPPRAAAEKIFTLLSRSMELGYSGVRLKDESPLLSATKAKEKSLTAGNESSASDGPSD